MRVTVSQRLRDALSARVELPRDDEGMMRTQPSRGRRAGQQVGGRAARALGGRPLALPEAEERVSGAGAGP